MKFCSDAKIVMQMKFKNQTTKYRPQFFNTRRRLKYWREYREYTGELNWQTTMDQKTFTKMGWPRVYKIGQHLHYLACHAPLAVRPKWQSAWQRFVKKYRNF